MRTLGLLEVPISESNMRMQGLQHTRNSQPIRLGLRICVCDNTHVNGIIGSSNVAPKLRSRARKLLGKRGDGRSIAALLIEKLRVIDDTAHPCETNDSQEPVRVLIDRHDNEVLLEHIDALGPFGHQIVTPLGHGQTTGVLGRQLGVSQALVEEGIEHERALALLFREHFVIEILHIKVHHNIVKEFTGIQAHDVVIVDGHAVAIGRRVDKPTATKRQQNHNRAMNRLYDNNSTIKQLTECTAWWDADARAEWQQHYHHCRLRLVR